jgi:hypothetical protein
LIGRLCFVFDDDMFVVPYTTEMSFSRYVTFRHLFNVTGLLSPLAASSVWLAGAMPGVKTKHT